MPLSSTPTLKQPVRSTLYCLGHRLITRPEGSPVELALEDVTQLTGYERVLLLVTGVSGFEVVGSLGIEDAADYLTRAPLAAALVTRATETLEPAYLIPGMECEGLDVEAELAAMDARLIQAVPLSPPGDEFRRERRRSTPSAAPVLLYMETAAQCDVPTLEERAQMALLARQTLTGLIAARLFIEATTDPATGAYVRGHFDRALAEEVTWARETGRPLTVLALAMMGAGAGDSRERSLERAAEVVRSALRTGDLLGRYGPDELAAALPGASAVEVQAVARRLAARLAAASLAGYVGAACFPDHADNAQALLARADQAAAAAAASGRPLVWCQGLPEVPGRPERLAALLTGEAAADYRRVQTLLETTQAVNQTRDTRGVMLAALKAVLSLTGADRALVLLGDAKNLSVEAGMDCSGQELPSTTPHSRSIPRQVLRTGRAVCLRDTTGQQTGDSVRTLALRSVLCVPLTAGGRTVGVLYVDSINAAYELAERDLAFFEAFAAHVALALENARLAEKLRDENTVLRRVQDEAYPVEGIIGRSPAMRRVLRSIRDLAYSNAPVLILGESGTGKELVARAIHQLSSRSEGPFVAQNCAAIPQDLLESELFGYVPGAFSGAKVLKKGLFELAHGGTFFLDEIADLDLLLQAKLLRVIEERSLRRIGDVRSIRIDFRLVSATNRDLKAETDAGRFRSDLYYRLNVLTVELPPLRLRREDIPLLVEHFVQRNEQDKGLSVPQLTPAALECLVRHDWPGNVRELMNVVEKGTVLARGGPLQPHHLGLDEPKPVRPGGGQLRDEMDKTERRIIESALADHGGNITHAARALGIARQQLQRLLKKHAIKPRA